MTAEKLSDQGSKTIRKTQTEKNGDIEGTVDKWSCSQVESGILSHHHIIGQAYHHNTDLSDDNGDTQTDEGFVMFFIGCEIAHVA